ncbi:MAG: HD domain-containing protein [Bacilli bacterium]|nr:HD domain-containing protein [Bacilli bacterium]
MEEPLDDVLTNDGLFSLRALRLHLHGEPILEQEAKKINDAAPLLKEADPSQAMLLLRDILLTDQIGCWMLSFIPVFTTLFPGLAPTVGFDQHTRWHAHTLYVHITHVVAGVQPDFITRLAAVLHDNGKVRTVSVENKEDGSFVYHFPGHPAVSEDMARPILKKYGLPEEEAKEILFLIGRHDNTIAPTPKSVRKILSRILNLGLGHPLLTLKRLLDIQKSDHADHTMLVPIPSEEILHIADKILAEI